MAKFLCKVCGERLEPIDGAVVATCGICGARQALPMLLSDEYLERYAELVCLQQGGMFEEAEEHFENMLLDGGADADLYWMGVLIEYRAVYQNEEEQGAYKIICGKPGEESVLENESFQKVLHYASPAQRGIFEKDGKLLESTRFGSRGEHESENEAENPLNRGFLCLEDGAWDAAMAQFDRVLAESPENALAYFGKMMADLQIHREGELSRAGTRMSETEYYEKVLEYGDEVLCDRLKKYRESGILYQATERGKCAETIDDWKHVKKLLMEIHNNERAAEYLSLCDRKIRAIMVREAQLVMGCREAVNLGLTTDTLGTRMVSANYYYDFDMSDEVDLKEGKKLHMPSSRAVAIFALIVMLLLVGLFAVSFLLGKDSPAETETSEPDNETQKSTYQSFTENAGLTVSDDEQADTEPEFCVVGSRAFILERNGSVKLLNEPMEEETMEVTQNGASFALNESPYESDFTTWSDVAGLYSDPDGAMLFGVMENGTVSYDIFSSSNMNYEDTYKAVSSWMNVKKLVWESGDTQKPCLFAITKDGKLYASDAAADKNLKQILDPMLDHGAKIEMLGAQGGMLHLILEDGSYVSVNYK